MAGERTVPLLPCRDIDEIVAFYEMLGFRKTYRQVRPNPHAVLEREDIGIHFFGMPGFDPEQSYGSCLVQVPDADALYKSFAYGLRKALGKVPLSGIPRMTRPRKKQDAVYGFSVIDPGGNWIRISQKSVSSSDSDEPATGLTRILENAVVLGDSKGAARLLDKSLESYETATPVERMRALIYRIELALAMADPETARDRLPQVRGMELEDADRQTLEPEFERLAELEQDIKETGG